MNICVIGTGYVGLVLGTCMAETGNNVICMDIDENKIERLKKGDPVIYEPGLDALMKRNIAERRLEFTTDLDYAVKNSFLNFIAVGTPQGEDGSADLKYVLIAAKAIGRAMDAYKIIINKSTVPVGTAERVREAIAEETDFDFDLVSNPEFLKEGAAIDDFMKPDRVIIGTSKADVAEIMKEVYAPFVRTGKPILFMDIKSAEMTKYASNAMLATRISFMNELSHLCEKIGADIEMVRRGMSSDSRIGSAFLFAGSGYGGSCFPKDIKALIKMGHENGLDMEILNAVESVNTRQKKILIEKAIKHFSSLPSVVSDKLFHGKKVALWGLAFKPQTDDMREAPALEIVRHLLEYGAEVSAYDPVAVNTAKVIFGESVNYAENAYDCLNGADCLMVVTEWNEFRNPNYDKMLELMKFPVIFDGRNLYDIDKMGKKGFTYFCVGRG